MEYRIRNGNRVVGTIGGRNYLRDSDKAITGWIQDLGTLPSETLNLLAGKTITVSCDVEWSGYVYNSTKQNRLGFEISTTDSNGQQYYLGAWESPTAPSGKTRVYKILYLPKSVTFTVWNNAQNGYVSIQGQGKVSHAKVEIGPVATPWSPAPEDYDIDRQNAYRVTGLAPNTSYDLSVAPFNGLREGPQKSITVHTRGLHVTVPTQLPMNATYNLTYEEYALGLVPIGTEPAGMFGGGNRQILPAKVVSSANGMSTIEITNSFNLMSDGLTMKQLPDGSYAAYDGYKALFLK
ncbi:hypothetical protein [Limosilactobacillus vaginalis]|uniref:hypothetical protein n=1 Tax=Limosilactobacillus vaginalis TaxID=1633 RepID=UPI003AAD1D8B